MLPHALKSSADDLKPDPAVEAATPKPARRRTRKAPETEAATQPPEGTELLGLARAALDEMKAEECVEIDLRGRTSLADHMVVASGRSNRHVASIAEEVARKVKEAGHGAPRIEGLPHADWVLIDAGDVIVHVFRPEVRQFYNLEKMWGVDRPSEPAAGESAAG